MTNVNNTTTSSDVTAAAVIASTAFASPTTIAAIAITGQKTAGAALAPASAGTKAIRIPTTIDGGIDDGSTVTTEITQNQANKIHRIQENLDNYSTSIEGISSFLRKLGHQK